MAFALHLLSEIGGERVSSGQEMTGRLRTSRGGLELIKSFEGFREAAVRLPDGRWTIGYGHVRSAREGLTISEQDAEDLLAHDLRPVEDAILSMIFAPLNQNQFDALVSLVFNISPGRFRDSDILRLLNGGDFLSAANAFDVWRKARIHGRVMVVDALVRRRAAEKAMFLEHPGGRPSAPTPLVRPELDVDSGETSSRAAAAETDHEPPAIEPVEDQTNTRKPSTDIAEAVRRLAERTQEAVAPAPEPIVPPPRPAPKAEPAPAERTARSPDEIEDARREVAERVARILARAEGAIAEHQAAEARASVRPAPTPPPVSPAPRPAAPAARPAPAKTAREIPEDLPDFDAPPPPRSPVASTDNGRTFIDDTETYDPGRDPAELFEEAERKAREVKDRSQRIGPINGRMAVLAPWIAVLSLSLLGLAIGAVEGIKAGLAGWVPAVLALSFMLTAMSVYFMATRGREHAA
jgi:lysozyme